jgi:hypothetical protein
MVRFCSGLKTQGYTCFLQGLKPTTGRRLRVGSSPRLLSRKGNMLEQAPNKMLG